MSSDNSVPQTPLVQSLPATVPFVGPETQERSLGRPFKARIGANESVFGPSPKAIAAMQKAAQEGWKYGDPEFFELRQALAKHHGVAPEEVMVGEGIDGLFGYTVRLFVEADTAVVTSLGAYPTFNFHVAGFGGRLVTVPYRDDHEDPEALAEAASAERARLVYLANPDNPMGSWLPAERIATLAEALPPDCMLVLDEAYSDFLPADALLPLDTSRRNLLRFRTFSKAHGLAGLRVGYVIGHPEVIDSYNKIRNHFGLGRVTQAAALAAIEDQDYLAEVVDKVAAARATIGEIAAANGLNALPSATNFVAVDCGHDGAFAKRVLASLVEQGVFVRMPGVAPLDRCIRISAGKAEDLAALAEALPRALAEAQQS
ncbi:MAG: pyridoxal phosphate-dependent aminotransferase [Kiloniellales bacterium]